MTEKIAWSQCAQPLTSRRHPDVRSGDDSDSH
jgi:hypothetical protein